jgi:hypothetical protein
MRIFPQRWLPKFYPIHNPISRSSCFSIGPDSDQPLYFFTPPIPPQTASTPFPSRLRSLRPTCPWRLGRRNHRDFCFLDLTFPYGKYSEYF